MSVSSYTVSGSTNSRVNGVYVASGNGRFGQQNGVHVLAQHVTGQWGIGDGKVYLFLSKMRSDTPDKSLLWQYLVTDVYRDCTSLKVEATVMDSKPSESNSSAESARTESDSARKSSVPASSTQSADYVVARCPYIDANGEYVRDGAYSYSCVHSTDTTCQLYREGNAHWILSMNGRVACRTTSTSEVPPKSGWDYWKSVPPRAGFNPTLKMEVLPGKLVTGHAQSSPPPAPTTAPATPSAPAVSPSVLPIAPSADPPSPKGTSTTATSDKPSKPSTGNDLPGECVKLLAELANAPARRDLDQRKGKVQAQFDAADAADDFLLVAKLGMQLQQLEKESAQLPLSEEDYLTLADRHAALVQRVTDQCKELKVAKDFVALAAVAEHLGALKAVDISALPHTCDDDPVLPATTSALTLCEEEDDAALDPVLPPEAPTISK